MHLPYTALLLYKLYQKNFRISFQNYFVSHTHTDHSGYYSQIKKKKSPETFIVLTNL